MPGEDPKEVIKSFANKELKIDDDISLLRVDPTCQLDLARLWPNLEILIKDGKF